MLKNRISIQLAFHSIFYIIHRIRFQKIPPSLFGENFQLGTSANSRFGENAGSNKYYFTTKQRKFKGQGFGRNFAKKIAPP